MTQAPTPVPFTFDAAGEWTLGWYHAPALPWRRLPIVLCPPVGYEAIASYPTYAQLARALADAGFPVVRFDYHGTGDAAGDDQRPQRLRAWQSSVDAAIAQARRITGAQEVALFGLRLGAALAVDAAARAGGVDSLLLWAPCASGRAFARELRAGGTTLEDGTLHALGYHYSAETLELLASLDATKVPTAPARRALVIARDDMPAEGPMPKALRALGVDTQFRALPGYAAMVDEPRAGVLDEDTIDAVVDWFAFSPAAAPASAPAPLLAAAGEPRVTDGVRETVLRIGVTDSHLWGVLAEPAAGATTPTQRRGTAVVLLNVGGNYRIGPHRLYVTAARSMAAAGYRVLRLDLPGIGDSPPSPGLPWCNLYDKVAADDVRAALDELARRGCRDFVLMGVCSGSFVAFQSALVDPRVDSVVLMNSRLLEWNHERDGDSWQNSMQQYAKSTNWYKRALLRPEVWGRLLRGQVDVRLIATRFAALAAARLRRAIGLDREHEESVLRKMQRLCARGTQVLMLVSDADDGRDYVEFHFGAAGRRLREYRNFRMRYVPDADHTFSRPGNQAHVVPLLLEHLEQRPARVRTRPEEPGRAGYNRGLACRSSSVGRAAHS
ncbi:MAG TPA: alpha/beta fold hydrolase [Ramlibacter sp.]|nr:alpha/beta fold hydrolase [Ramlibacter sp.]